MWLKRVYSSFTVLSQNHNKTRQFLNEGSPRKIEYSRQSTSFSRVRPQGISSFSSPAGDLVSVLSPNGQSSPLRAKRVLSPTSFTKLSFHFLILPSLVQKVDLVNRPPPRRSCSYPPVSPASREVSHSWLPVQKKATLTLVLFFSPVHFLLDFSAGITGILF